MFGNVGNSASFASVGTARRNTNQPANFLTPPGACWQCTNSVGFRFVDGVSTLAQDDLEAHTRGRNIGAKPSQWKEGRCYGGRNSTATFQTTQRGVSVGLSTDGTHPVKQLVGKSVGTTMPFPNPNKNLNQ